MIAKESIITPQIIKEREDRHRRLMRMIKNYKRSLEEANKLQKIKDNTVLEINLRYIRSDHNKHYRFPKNVYHDDSEEEEDPSKSVNPFLEKQSKSYDLRTQNEIHKEKTKHVSFQNGRRVKSLNHEKNEQIEQRIGRFQQQKKHQGSYKQLRKKSMVEQKRVFSTIKLPQLIKKQKLKTESKNDSFELQKIVGKKLATEANSPREPRQTNALKKYLDKKDEKVRGSGKHLKSTRKIE